MEQPESLENLLQGIEELEIEHDLPQAKFQLNNYIKKIYEIIKEDSAISDWQKIQISSAIAAYKVDWLFLCKYSLLLAFESEDMISKETRYVVRHKEMAKRIDLDQLISKL